MSGLLLIKEMDVIVPAHTTMNGMDDMIQKNILISFFIYFLIMQECIIICVIAAHKKYLQEPANCP